jgi:GntR family transcriptional regulator / MocR family aminotransferase
LAARLLLNPGDPVWVEDPCFYAALGVLRAADAKLVPVPVDEYGINVRAGRVRCDDARVAYVTPSHQFPRGGIMPVSRRRELLDWADQGGAWIFEDDYDSEFHFRGRVIPSLQGLDSAGRVLYFGTFSKVVFPSLRIGYVVVPEDLVDLFRAARQVTDRHSSCVMQAVMTEFIGEGHFARHLKRMRTIYAEQQQAVVDALRAVLPSGIEIQAGDRGMHLIVWLPHTWSDAAVADDLAEAGVSVRALSSLTIENRQRPGLVLGYTGFEGKEMLAAVEKMAAVFRRKHASEAREAVSSP